MPGFDGTGPLGLGPRTGGGFGFCPPVAGRRFPVMGAGRGGFPWGGGRGRTFGGGRGWWWRTAVYPYFSPWYPWYPSTPEEEKANLEEELAFLKNRITEINAHLEELKEELKVKEEPQK